LYRDAEGINFLFFDWAEWMEQGAYWNF
jgi:hypothetical protein